MSRRIHHGRIAVILHNTVNQDFHKFARICGPADFGLCLRSEVVLYTPCIVADPHEGWRGKIVMKHLEGERIFGQNGAEITCIIQFDNNQIIIATGKITKIIRIPKGPVSIPIGGGSGQMLFACKIIKTHGCVRACTGSAKRWPRGGAAGLREGLTIQQGNRRDGIGRGGAQINLALNLAHMLAVRHGKCQYLLSITQPGQIGGA